MLKASRCLEIYKIILGPRSPPVAAIYASLGDAPSTRDGTGYGSQAFAYSLWRYISFPILHLCVISYVSMYSSLYDISVISSAYRLNTPYPWSEYHLEGHINGCGCRVQKQVAMWHEFQEVIEGMAFPDVWNDSV